MTVTPARRPMGGGVQVMASSPRVAVHEGVLSDAEASIIISLASSRMERAKVSLDDASGTSRGRTGSSCWLQFREDERLHIIGQRIANMVGMPLSHAESMQVIHYGPDQEYRAHFDAWDLSTARGQRCCASGGQRIVTALVYLNAIREGGATSFPNLDLEIRPKAGRMVVFENTGDDITRPHPDSLHAGTPVISGEKWAFNIWFRARPRFERQEF